MKQSPAAHFSPELDLLLCCARNPENSDEKDLVRPRVDASLNWELLLEAAHRHGLAPLLHRHLQPAADLVPTPYWHHLQTFARQTLQRNLFLTGELLAILDAFTAAGIAAVPYKGPSLAEQLYGNLALREFIDLDLFIRAHDIPAARQVLETRGYRPYFRLTPYQESVYLPHRHHEYIFFTADEKRVVELHWQIAPRFFAVPLEPECLWNRLTPATLAGKQVPSFAPEALLLVLCIHGCQHAWDKLKWLCDVRELLRRCPSLDWQWLNEQSRGLGCVRMVALAFHLASTLLGAELPSECAKLFRADGNVRALEAQVIQNLHTPSLGMFGLCCFHLRARERLRHRLRYLCESLAPNIGDWARVPLSKHAYFLYYPLRLARLAKHLLTPAG